MRPPIGEILLRHGHINDMQLAHALSQQERCGGRLGDILISQNAIGYLALYEAVAEHYALPFVDLFGQPPTADLPDEKDAERYLERQAIPWRLQNGCLLVAACDADEATRAWIATRYGPRARLVITSPFDIRRTVEILFGENMEAQSRRGLADKSPHISARTTFHPHQTYGLCSLVFMILAALIINPTLSSLIAIILCHLTYSASMLFKCLLFICGRHNHTVANWDEKLASLDERDLPIYTVLIPMYCETESLPGLLEAMQQLDYPASKLDIKLVLESDDRATLEAAYALKPCYQFDIIRVPPSAPRTKPKACNYALRFARGEFITIFDADDRPERTQLKKAVHAFRHLPPDVVCLQARLNYYNAGHNLLTRLFSLEYAILFHFMLYGLERLGIPIPLGGTSNHIALARLRELGEWDPYNVTEDADLGARLAAGGHKTAMLDSFTREESPIRVWPWIGQRSRWIKGYMQTWLVHMRNPAALRRALGWRSFLGFQFFVGLSGFIFLSAPLVWLPSLLWLGGSARADFLPDWLGRLTCINLGINLLSQWGFGLYCAALYRTRRLSFVIAALCYPLYLWLHSAASYKSLWQLIVKPHFWEKTTHGLARHLDSYALESK